MTNEKLEEIYYKYHRLVKDAAYQVLKDPYLAQAVCQEVFMRLSDEWIEKEQSSKERARYLHVAARHKAIDYKEAAKRRKEVSSASVAQPGTETGGIKEFEQKKDQTRLITDVLKALKEYKESWYTVLLRIEIYHEPAKFVARDMEISMVLLRVRLYRAKQWVNKNFGEEYQSLD